MRVPLVSILIPAYNVEEWVAESIESAVAQTWPRKEIIVVNDGSTDQTGEVARRSAAREVVVVSTENQGAAGARNHAFKLSQGDYIQWLDADDILAPDKVERQLAALRDTDSGRILLSSPRGWFYYRTERALFVPTSLWQDLSPVEWLLRKLGENLPMQTATWLTSRELAEAAGLWDTRLLSDDDGEYFCRVLLASEGTRFVPEARTFKRNTPSLRRLSYVGASNKKKEALLLSMKLHIQYLRSLEESERVRKACLVYLQTWYGNFYPERPDLVAELQSLAAKLGGQLEPPGLSWKYAWIRPVLGSKAAKSAQMTLPQIKTSWLRRWDKAMYKLEGRDYNSQMNRMADAVRPPEDYGRGHERPRLSENTMTFKQLVKTTVNRLGLSVTRFPPQHLLSSCVRDLLKEGQINLVLDVGAFHGAYCKLLRREVGYTGRIVSFEPCAESFQTLSAQMAADQSWRGYPLALGSTDSTALLNTYDSGDFNSILPLRDDYALAFRADLSNASAEAIKINTIDAIWDDITIGIECPRVFLKMDTQGYDVEVILGARDHLHCVYAVQSELPAIEIYEGMTSMPRALELYRELGYVPVGFWPVCTPPRLCVPPEFDVLLKALSKPSSAESCLSNSAVLPSRGVAAPSRRGLGKSPKAGNSALPLLFANRQS